MSPANAPCMARSDLAPPQRPIITPAMKLRHACFSFAPSVFASASLRFMAVTMFSLNCEMAWWISSADERGESLRMASIFAFDASKTSLAIIPGGSAFPSKATIMRLPAS